jgi:hypothetical protein
METCGTGDELAAFVHRSTSAVASASWRCEADTACAGRARAAARHPDVADGRASDLRRALDCRWRRRAQRARRDLRLRGGRLAVTAAAWLERGRGDGQDDRGRDREPADRVRGQAGAAGQARSRPAAKPRRRPRAPDLAPDGEQALAPRSVRASFPRHPCRDAAGNHRHHPAAASSSASAAASASPSAASSACTAGSACLSAGSLCAPGGRPGARAGSHGSGSPTPAGAVPGARPLVADASVARAPGARPGSGPRPGS